MSRLKVATALGCLVALAALARAETADDAKSRFAMSPVDGGFLRLDKETGLVAHCAKKADEWLCEPIEDRSKAISEKVARLEAENQTLKDRVKALEESLETGKPVTGAEPPAGKMQLPTEEEVDKALDYVERIFKKFRDRIDRIEKSTPKAEGQSGNL